MVHDSARRRTLAAGIACSVAALLLIGVVALSNNYSNNSSSSIALFQDITGGADRLVDPALMRLSNDPWFTSITDTTLTKAAEDVARQQLEQVIIHRVNRMSHGYPGADLDKLTRVAEEQVIYDEWIVKRATEEVEKTISPTPHSRELAAVRALEEKLKAKMMQSLVKEAIREINLLVDATDESANVKQMAKDHLLDRTQNILMPQVEGRVARFIQSRIPNAARAGVQHVLRYLAHSVNEEEKRELLGGPLVEGVDYSFQNEQQQQQQQNNREQAAKMRVTSKMSLANKQSLRKSLLPETPDQVGAANPSAPEAGVAAAAGTTTDANEENDGTNVNVGLVIFVVSLLAVIGLLAVLSH